MAFFIACPNCKSRLNAKEELIGQTRPCPKCKTPVLITDPAASAPAEMPIATGLGSAAQQLPPTTLQRHNKYIICGASRVLAFWESGRGWMFQVGNGFAPAKSNHSAIPDQGTFVLVELVVGNSPQDNSPSDNSPAGDLSSGLAPQAMRFFQITQRGALTALARDEAEILRHVKSPVALTQPQRSTLHDYCRRQFMFTFWEGAPIFMEYLSSTSYQPQTQIVR